MSSNTVSSARRAAREAAEATDLAPRDDARARISRAQEEVRRARRRDPNDRSMDMNLFVEESLLDREQFEYRWVKNIKGRVSRLERQDWDRVVDTADNAIGVSRHAGVGDDSEKSELVLMRKYKDWKAEDDKAKQTERENMMTRVDPIVTEEGGLNKDVSYRPKDAVAMTHERGARPE